MVNERLAERKIRDLPVDSQFTSTSRSLPGNQASHVVSRRSVVKTGTRLIYAAPLVVASIKLESDSADAISGGVRPIHANEE